MCLLFSFLEEIHNICIWRRISTIGRPRVSPRSMSIRVSPLPSPRSRQRRQICSVVDAQAPCMAQMAFLHRARLLAPQMRVILLTSQKDFSVAQAAFDLRVDALLVWSELDAEIFSSRVDRVVSELDEMIHRRGIVKRQLFRDILKGKIPTEGGERKIF